MRAVCPVCLDAVDLFVRSFDVLVCRPCSKQRSCFRPVPSEGRGVSGRKVSPARAGDGGEASAPLSLGLPANPSGDTPHSVKGVGASRHAVPGPFDGDC